MTKRSVISVVAILAAIVLAFGMAATACGHEHTFASAWETDATHHWHAATCEHADEKADLGEHVPAAPVRELYTPSERYFIPKPICRNNCSSAPLMTRPMVSKTAVPTNSVRVQFLEIEVTSMINTL